MSNRTLGIIAAIGAIIVAFLVVVAVRTEAPKPPVPKTAN
jgi:hypothetical protein